MPIRKEFIAIIALTVSLIVGIILLVTRINDMEDTDQIDRQMSEYKAEQSKYEIMINTNKDLIKQNIDILAEIADKIESEKITISQLNHTLNETKTKYEQDHLYYKFHNILGGSLTGISVIANIYYLIDNMLLENNVTKQNYMIAKLDAARDSLDGKVEAGKNEYFDHILYENLPHFGHKRQLLYDSVRDGLSVQTFQQKVCSSPYILLIINTTFDYQFGVITGGYWTCEGKKPYDDYARTFSITHMGYATLKQGHQATCYDSKYVVCIGDHDIVVDEHGAGTLQPERSYDIPPPFIADGFYNPINTFNVKQIQAWNITITFV